MVRETPSPAEDQMISQTKTSCLIPWSLVNQQGRRLKVSPLKCKCWECARCGPMKKKQLSFKARAGKPTKMITLTASSISGPTPDVQAQHLRTAWKQLRRKAQKVWKQGKIEFIAIFEKTQHGYPHLHILTRMKYVPQAWLSTEMDRLTGSPIVDIRRIKNRRQAAAYVSKYTAKDPIRFRKCKRYWTSLSYHQPFIKPLEKNTEAVNPWYVVRQPHHDILPVLYKKGFFEVEPTRQGDLVWTRDNDPPHRPGHTLERWHN